MKQSLEQRQHGEGLSVADYVRESIIAPDVHVVDGFVVGQMHPGWDQYLTPEQIESLVALLVERS